MTRSFNWTQSLSYCDPSLKRQWHATARKRLARLATDLGLEKGTFDVRSNMAGIAVSGEVTLHGESIYVQVSQPCMGGKAGILIRTCKGRRDYSGGPNHFASLDLLNNPIQLANRVRGVMAGTEPRLMPYQVA